MTLDDLLNSSYLTKLQKIMFFVGFILWRRILYNKNQYIFHEKDLSVCQQYEKIKHQVYHLLITYCNNWNYRLEFWNLVANQITLWFLFSKIGLVEHALWKKIYSKTIFALQKIKRFIRIILFVLIFSFAVFVMHVNSFDRKVDKSSFWPI